MITTSQQALVTLRRTIFFVSMPFFMLGLMLPVYGKEIGASLVEIGLFFSAFSLMTVIMRPVVGWALDRFGRRIFYIAGVAGYALTMVGFAVSDQASGILVARIMQGIASSFLWISASAIIADSAQEQERGQVFGRFTQASTQGSILGTFLGFTLINTMLHMEGKPAQLSSWSVLFLVYGAAALVALFLALRSLPETRPQATSADKTPILWSKNWLLLLVVTLVTGASAAMISPILIIFLQERLGIGMDTLSWAFLPAALVWALLPARFGKLADRYGRKSLMLIGLGAAAVSSFFIPALGTVAALAILWAVQAACYAAGDTAEQALVADLTGQNARGRAYGLVCDVRRYRRHHRAARRRLAVPDLRRRGAVLCQWRNPGNLHGCAAGIFKGQVKLHKVSLNSKRNEHPTITDFVREISHKGLQSYFEDPLAAQDV